jgi:thiol-disulfide isomerase/thioredoxin
VIIALASFVLAAVFSVAAAAKLADREGSRGAIVAFGVPERAAGLLQWLLIAGELAVAAALLIDRSRPAGAVGALVLLAVMTAAVAASLSRGRAPECHCLGRLSRGPIGPSTVARNGLLASIAGYVAVGGETPGVFVGLALAFGGAWLVLGPLSRRIRRRAAPNFSLGDQIGNRWTLQRLMSGDRPVLLVFSQPSCGACHALLPDLEEWQLLLGDRLTVAVVNQGIEHESGGPVAHQPSYPTLTDPDGAVAQAYGVTATPSATLIEPNGRTPSGLARGAPEIGELVRVRFATEDPPRFPRRTVIARAVRGTATLGAFPLVAAACGSSSSSSRKATSSTAATSSRPKALQVGNAHICRQTYALCTNAPCVPSPHDPNVVVCDCVVESGYSVGLTPCPQRAAHGTTVYSTFSTALATSSIRALSCPASTPWANCVDSICELDPKDSNKARCQCPLVKRGPSFTFGGDCDTHTCGKTIWSGAHTTLGGNQVADAMKRLGQPLVLPAPCPK